MYIYIYPYGGMSLILGSTKSTIPPSVTQVDPSWAIERSPKVHMRKQTFLLWDTADMSAVKQVC